MSDTPDIWYSCDIQAVSIADDWGDHVATGNEVYIREYVVTKYTPKGVKLRGFMTGEFFVLGTATRQRAVPTKELAIRDAIKRKERHIRGCEARLAFAEQQLLRLRRELNKHERAKP